MSHIKCEECGFMYECVNYQPCPTCKLLQEEKEPEQLEFFFDGEYTFEMRNVA